MRIIANVWAIMGFVFLLPIMSFSATIHVPADQLTIQAGINAAVNGDTVLVADGFYRENIDFKGKQIIVTSVNGPYVTTIRARNVGEPVVTITKDEPKGTEISGFTITESGLGILIEHSSPTIKDNIIWNNCCGGGITLYNTSGTIIRNNLIYNNQCGGENGGAIIVGTNGTTSMNDSICYNIMYSNFADCNIQIGVNADSLNIYNNTLKVGQYAGLINHANGHVDLRNNIIFAGLHYGVLNYGLSITAEYNCLFNNGENYHNVSPGVGNIYVNALFTDPNNNDYSLQPSSPCIDAGDPNPIYNDPDESRNDIGALPIYVPYPPIMDNIGDMAAFEGDVISVIIHASDRNNTIPILTAEGVPSGGNFIDSGNGYGSFNWAIPYGVTGVFPALFIASDGVLADSELVTITVNPAPPSVVAMTIDNSFPAVHLLNHIPPINWDFFDPGNDNPQTQFEIAVGTDSNWSVAEMWDPGSIASADTFVTYAGAPLVDGETYYLRLRVHNGIVWSNWYYTSFRMNSVPSIPSMVYPLDSGLVNSLQPTVRALKSSDPEDSYLLYDFEVITRGGQMVVHEYDIAGAGDTIRWQIPENLSENEIYWWRIRSYDSYEHSNWSSYQPFWVNATEEPPFAFDLIGPPDTSGSKIFNMLPEFSWTESLDPDPRDSARYTFYLAIDSNFQFVLTVDSLWTESYTHPDSLLFATKYWWKVKATDKTGLHIYSTNTLNFRTWKLGDANGDWNLNALDVTFLINSLYKHGPKSNPLKAGDINGSCTTNALDITYLINNLYKGGPAPKIGCE